MNYYAIQVRTTAEEKYMALARKVLSPEEGRLIFPRKRLTIRKHGILRNEDAPVFPGYVFWAGEGLSPEVYWKLKRIDGFFRFLAKDDKPTLPLALEGRDRDILLHFIGFGEIAEKSKVYFDENDRIVILEGPLKGLEGFIIKVDKRKRRAKIRLAFCNQDFPIDLGFEAMERTKAGPSNGRNAQE